MIMSTFLQNIFETPILKGSSSNQLIPLEIVTRAYQLRAGLTQGNLVSEHWDLAESSSDPEAWATAGVTSFNSTESLNLLSDWGNVTAFIEDFAGTMVNSIGAGNIKLTNMWTTIYPQGAFVPEHVHSNSVFSGVFYAQAEPHCGETVFHDPAWVAKTMCFPQANNTSLVATKYRITPETGVMVIFPGWLPHRSLPNRSTGDRIIVSFNMG